MAKNKWNITSQYINGVEMYEVYRIKDTTQVDYAGNREYALGSYTEDRAKAQEVCDKLNDAVNKERYIELLKPIVAEHLNDNGYFEIYWDYRDELDARSVLQAYKNKLKCPEETIEGFIAQQLWELNLDYDFHLYEMVEKDIQDEISNEGGEELAELYNEYGLEWDYLEEAGYNGVDINLHDLLRNTRLCVNVMFATPCEENYDMSSIITAYGCWKEPCPTEVDDLDNALTYLIHQQGHSVKEIYDCLLGNPRGFTSENSNTFAKSVVNDIVNNTSEHISSVCALVELSGEDIITFFDAVAEGKKYLSFDKTTEIGLFNDWSGAGGLLEIQLDKPFVVPVDMVKNIQIEGAGKENSGYTVNEVYGLIGSCWKDCVSYTDDAPELYQEDMAQVLEEVTKLLEEQDKDITDD